MFTSDCPGNRTESESSVPVQFSRTLSELPGKLRTQGLTTQSVASGFCTEAVSESFFTSAHCKTVGTCTQSIRRFVKIKPLVPLCTKSAFDTCGQTSAGSVSFG
jgi:hypothetical protein